MASTRARPTSVVRKWSSGGSRMGVLPYILVLDQRLLPYISHIFCLDYHIYPNIHQLLPYFSHVSMIKQHIKNMANYKVPQDQVKVELPEMISSYICMIHIWRCRCCEQVGGYCSVRKETSGWGGSTHWGGCSGEKRGRNRAATKLRDQERNTREMQLIALPSFKERLALERWGEIAPRWG